MDYFQADNVDNNDIYIRVVLKDISSSTSIIHWRLRCYGHVINLSVKVFLFGNDPDAFEFKINNLEKFKLEIRYERELLTL